MSRKITFIGFPFSAANGIIELRRRMLLSQLGDHPLPEDVKWIAKKLPARRFVLRRRIERRGRPASHHKKSRGLQGNH